MIMKSIQMFMIYIPCGGPRLVTRDNINIYKYSIRVNIGNKASDVVRIVPTATHTIAQVKQIRDELVEKEVLRLRSEWINAGHGRP